MVFYLMCVQAKQAQIRRWRDAYEVYDFIGF